MEVSVIKEYCPLVKIDAFVLEMGYCILEPDKSDFA
jgi:hypothetical protein